jgi:hypothetical protein
MKKVTIELPDGNDDLLSITAVGQKQNGNQTITNVRTCAFDLSQGRNIRYINGNWIQLEEVTE